MTESTFPTQARVVVVGGGIMGCSTAYHLTQLGWRDVLLLEQAKLTSGSTWHAAGLVGQLRAQAGVTQLLGHSVALYQSLEAQTGLSTGWKMSGGLRLACNDARMTELKRQASTARSFGLDMELLSPSEALALWPAMRIDNVVGAVFLASDGQANPADITQALAKGARNGGARLIEDCRVTGVRVESGRVRGVETATGVVECEVVVNCCGQWARQFAEAVGVSVPLVPVRHQYLITEPIEGLPRDLPTLRDPDYLTYYKEEVGGLVMGGYEPNPIAWGAGQVPEDFSFSLLDSDWNHFEPLMKNALQRVPALEDAGVKQLVTGPESFTPDGNFILGRAPELAGYFVGAGFNSFGIAAGGGAGQALAAWIVEGEAPYDLWAVDIRRFGPHHRDAQWNRTRTLEMYAKHYTIAWPHEEHQSARPTRRSPLYNSLAAAGACFGEKLGWERANWFGSKVTPRDEYSFARPNWFEALGEEHRAVRERVGIIDQSSFAKYLMVGADAESVLSRICANDVARPPGSLIYTQMLNHRGGVECDLTVARLAPDRYYLTTGTGFATHDFDWIARHIPSGTDAHLIDITSSRGVLSLMGPAARKVLESLTDADISQQGFAFATARSIRVAGAPVLALRITYVGELGWELHVPTEFVQGVYDALVECGREHGICNVGYRAIETLRLEKAYRAWGAELTPDHTPLEAGLGWAVKLGKNVDFIGREALQSQLAGTLAKQLVGFSVDDPSVTLLGRETILRAGKRVGWLTSGGYGYSVGKSIGYGYVRNPDGISPQFLSQGVYELDVATERVACSLFRKPLYDPGMTRIKR